VPAKVYFSCFGSVFNQPTERTGVGLAEALSAKPTAPPLAAISARTRID
jgi:hypothetical protein